LVSGAPGFVRYNIAVQIRFGKLGEMVRGIEWLDPARLSPVVDGAES
jgi:hypothetical protein